MEYKDPDSLRKMYHDIGQNLEHIKLGDFLSILGLSVLSLITIAETLYSATKGDFYQSAVYGVATVIETAQAALIYRRAVRNIGNIY